MKKIVKKDLKNKLVGYVALLRGINVGGKSLVKMADLKKIFESLGFQNVRTLLNSGNVLFLAPKSKNHRSTIEKVLEKKYGRKIGVLIRTSAEIQALIEDNPFKKIKVTPETRLYITFFSEKPKSLKAPSFGPNFKILRLTDSEVASVLVLTPKGDTTKLMSNLEKEYGKNVTTRNWNTVQKLIK